MIYFDNINGFLTEKYAEISGIKDELNNSRYKHAYGFFLSIPEFASEDVKKAAFIHDVIGDLNEGELEELIKMCGPRAVKLAFSISGIHDPRSGQIDFGKLAESLFFATGSGDLERMILADNHANYLLKTGARPHNIDRRRIFEALFKGTTSKELDKIGRCPSEKDTVDFMIRVLRLPEEVVEHSQSVEKQLPWEASLPLKVSALLHEALNVGDLERKKTNFKLLVSARYPLCVMKTAGMLMGHNNAFDGNTFDDNAGFIKFIAESGHEMSVLLMIAHVRVMFEEYGCSFGNAHAERRSAVLSEAERSAAENFGEILETYKSFDLVELAKSKPLFAARGLDLFIRSGAEMTRNQSCGRKLLENKLSYIMRDGRGEILNILGEGLARIRPEKSMSRRGVASFHA